MADVRFATRYFVGDGIDIGSGTDSIKQYQHLSLRAEDHWLSSQWMDSEWYK
jgi:hypothetical protein